MTQTGTVAKMVDRYRIALLVWFLATLHEITLFFLTQVPSWKFELGAGDKSFSIVVVACSASVMIIAAIGVTLWALAGPKVVEVPIPESAALSDLIKALDETRKVVEGAHVAHEGLHPASLHHSERR